ncbi:MAG: TetR family transcriptional regulator [Peptococcaceae bacterium]|nr:TetR family transcriptional regulator [Peptococcaceae bacterium]
MRRQLVATKTREKYRSIIEAAIKIIAENGYHSSQVAKIAREAGVAEGTIYLYFKNKEDILISIFRDKLGEFISIVPHKLKGMENSFEILANLIYWHFFMFQNNRKLAHVLQIELRQSDKSIRKGISEVIKQYYLLIESLVRDGMEKGYFRPELDPKVARKVIFGSMDEVATCWVLSSRDYNLLDMAEQVYTFLAKAMARDNKFKPFSEALKHAPAASRIDS